MLPYLSSPSEYNDRPLFVGDGFQRHPAKIKNLQIIATPKKNNVLLFLVFFFFAETL
jgi:hypothetical protein